MREREQKKMSRLAEELIRVKEEGVAAVLVTVVEAEENGRVKLGEKCLVRDGRIKVGAIRHE